MDGATQAPSAGMTAASELVDVIIKRQAARLVDPAPDGAALEAAFAAALAAPDHKQLRPWRFFVIRGEARADLGQVLAQCLLDAKPGIDPSFLDKERAKPMRAPMVILAAAKITPDMGVPEIEQVLAAGAATENLLLALHAQGYAGAWKTGGAAYSDRLKATFGLSPSDHIVGLLYVGTTAGPLPPRKALDVADFVTEWSAGA